MKIRHGALSCFYGPHLPSHAPEYMQLETAHHFAIRQITASLLDPESPGAEIGLPSHWAPHPVEEGEALCELRRIVPY